MEGTRIKKNITTDTLVKQGLFIGIICLLSLVKIPLPFSPIKITLQSLGIMLVGFFLPPLNSLFVVVGYIFLGIIGLPVFSSFGSSFGHLMGPSGGFLFGFLPGVLLFSFLIRKNVFKKTSKILGWFYLFFSIFLFHLILYASGLFWYIFTTSTDFKTSLGLVILPFIPGDFLKSIAFLLIYKRLKDLKAFNFY